MKPQRTLKGLREGWKRKAHSGGLEGAEGEDLERTA
jgi:hypothetical protein